MRTRAAPAPSRVGRPADGWRRRSGHLDASQRPRRRRRRARRPAGTENSACLRIPVRIECERRDRRRASVSVSSPRSGLGGNESITQPVTFGVDVVEEHVDDHGHTGSSLGGVGCADGRTVGPVDREAVRRAPGARFGAVAVDDRVLELVEPDVARLRCVHDRGRGPGRPRRSPCPDAPTFDTAIASPSGS